MKEHIVSHMMRNLLFQYATVGLIKGLSIVLQMRNSSKATNGNSRTNYYTTCKIVQLVIKREGGSC